MNPPVLNGAQKFSESTSTGTKEKPIQLSQDTDENIMDQHADPGPDDISEIVDVSGHTSKTPTPEVSSQMVSDPQSLEQHDVSDKSVPSADGTIIAGTSGKPSTSNAVSVIEEDTGSEVDAEKLEYLSYRELVNYIYSSLPEVFPPPPFA